MVVLCQLVFFLLGGPLAIGFMRKIRARVEGRRGAPIIQPYRELSKLWRKQTIEPVGASAVFRFAPYFLFGTSLTIAAAGPFWQRPTV